MASPKLSSTLLDNVNCTTVHSVQTWAYIDEHVRVGVGEVVGPRGRLLLVPRVLPVVQLEGVVLLYEPDKKRIQEFLEETIKNLLSKKAFFRQRPTYL